MPIRALRGGLSRGLSIFSGLALGLALCGPVAGQGNPSVRAASRTPVRGPVVRLTSAAETESYWFRLDSPWQAPRSEDRPVGVAHWISGPLDPDRPQAGRRVELELVWLGSDVRLLVTERILPGEHRVLWREQLAGGGRTVMISVDRTQPSAPLKVTETAAGKVRRRTLPRDSGAWQLLGLIESACHGAEPHGSTRVLMPQKAAVEEVSLRLDLESSPANRRELSLTFADGLEGPTFRFEERELTGFTWQAGGPVATRVSAQEHARWVRGTGAHQHDRK